MLLNCLSSHTFQCLSSSNGMLGIFLFSISDKEHYPLLLQNFLSLIVFCDYKVLTLPLKVTETYVSPFKSLVLIYDSLT